MLDKAARFAERNYSITQQRRICWLFFLHEELCLHIHICFLRVAFIKKPFSPKNHFFFLNLCQVVEIGETCPEPRLRYSNEWYKCHINPLIYSPNADPPKRSKRAKKSIYFARWIWRNVISYAGHGCAQAVLARRKPFHCPAMTTDDGHTHQFKRTRGDHTSEQRVAVIHLLIIRRICIIAGRDRGRRL